MITALVITIIITIIVIVIIVCSLLYRPAFELILDGKTLGITNSYGLNPDKTNTISMDFKLKQQLQDESLVGLFCIGFREPSSPTSKKYYMSMNKSLLQMRILVQEPSIEKAFTHDLDVDLFDDKWHHMSVIIDASTQAIHITFDNHNPITIADNTGKYPMGTADKAYIGGIVDGYKAVGIIKNVMFGNVLKTFKLVTTTTA